MVGLPAASAGFADVLGESQPLKLTWGEENDGREVTVEVSMSVTMPGDPNTATSVGPETGPSATVTVLP